MDFKYKKYFLRYFGEELGPRVENAFVNGGIASVLGRGFPILALMICARLLDPDAFGKFMMIYGAIISFAMLTDAGLGTTVTKFTAQYKNLDTLRVSQIISLAQYISVFNIVILTSALILFGDEVARYILADGSLKQYLVISIVIILFNGLCSIQQAILYGLEDYRSVKKANFNTGLIILLSLPIGAMFFGVIGMLITLSIAKFVNVVVLLSATQSNFILLGIDRFGGIERNDFKTLIGFSFPTFLNSLLFGPVILFTMSIVAHHFDGHVQVGIYNAAYQWFSFVIFIPGVFTVGALPILSEQINRGNVERAEKLVKDKIKFILYLLSPVVIVLMLLSPFIMKLYGDGYEDSWKVLLVLMVAVLIALPQGLLGNYIISNDKVWRWFVSSIAWALTFISVTYILVDFGALGIAIGLLAAYISRAIFAIYFFKIIQRSSN